MELNFLNAISSIAKRGIVSDDATLETFATNGFAIIRNEWTQEFHEEIALEIERIHQDFSDLKLAFPELYKLGEWSIRSPHLPSKSINSFIFSAPFKNICSSLIGDDVDMYWTTTATKPVQCGKSFPWHQDAGYGKGPAEYITCWTAFDKVDQENGCLWAIPGSHKQDVLPHEFRKSNEENYAGIFLKDLNIDLSSAIPIILNPGDIACMHSKLIHASTPNLSGRKRRAMIAAYAHKQQIERFRNQIEEVPLSFLRKGKMACNAQHVDQSAPSC